MRFVFAVFLLTVGIGFAGCTSFSNVRSAEVQPGPSVGIHASVSTPPGPEAGWFWSYDCAEACDHPVVGADIGFTHGWLGGRFGSYPVTLGAGLNGTHPYAEGFVQTAEGARPFGLGARLGLPLSGWYEHQIYARYDVRLGPSTRLLVNPAVFVHHGRSPNGENPGSFIAFVQGVGFLMERERVSIVPGASLVVGQAERNSYGRRYGPAMSVFGTASLGITLRRRKSAR